MKESSKSICCSAISNVSDGSLVQWSLINVLMMSDPVHLKSHLQYYKNIIWDLVPRSTHNIILKIDFTIHSPTILHIFYLEV